MKRGGLLSDVTPWEALVRPGQAGDVSGASAAAPRPTTRVLVVLGAAGGVGATMVACALALGLADAAAPVGLLEFDFERGDLAGAWGVPADRTIDDLAPVVKELERHHVELVAHRHASNVAVVLGHGRAGRGGTWDRPATSRLLDRAATLGAVVVDAGCSHAAHVEEACAQAGQVVVVAAPTIAGARRVRALLGNLQRWELAGELLLVANRGAGRDHLSARAFARAVGRAVTVDLPRSDREAADLGAGRWPARRRRSLRSAIDDLVDLARAG